MCGKHVEDIETLEIGNDWRETEANLLALKNFSDEEEESGDEKDENVEAQFEEVKTDGSSSCGSSDGSMPDSVQRDGDQEQDDDSDATVPMPENSDSIDC